MRGFEAKHESLADFGDLLEPHEAQEPILARPIRNALMDWLTEVWAAKDLAKVGLKPRKKAIFDGAPGVGKTTLAHHLAARLGLRMLAVRADRLVGSYIGETARGLGALFDCVGNEDEPFILFFDEFDAIALKRREARQSADEERNNWVNTLLQRVEQLDGFLIAATNHGRVIDPAIWRRFEIHITLDLPGQEERERILERYLAPFVIPAAPLRALAAAFDTASPALMRQFAEGIKRQLVVGPKAGWNMSREAVIDRLVVSVTPHPDLPKPPLWIARSADESIKRLPWPLEMGAVSPPRKKAA